MLAAAKNNVQIIRVLVDSEAKMVDNRGFTALMYTAANDCKEACSILAEREARIQGPNGMTALMIAALHHA